MATDTSIPADDSAAWQAEPTYTTACELAYKALLEHVPNFQHGAKSRPGRCSVAHCRTADADVQ